MIKEGQNAPDFSLQGSDGKMHRLSDFKGKNLVLYFYPRDDTPGCTIEARGFNELLEKYDKLGAAIVGISTDGIDSHKKFCDKYSLRFLLLSDPDSNVIKKYDAYGNKGVFGFGTIRKTYIIDKKGKIAKIFGKVQAIGHNQEVLSVLGGK